MTVVLANGPLDDPAVVRRRLAALRPGEVIAADGGALHAASLGVVPSLVIGDLDSLPGASIAALEAGGAALEHRPPDKDQTDLELALLAAARRGAAGIVVIGAVGGRLDMTLANAHLLAHPDLSQLALEIWSGEQTARRLLPPGGDLPGTVGDTVSLLPLPEAGGVTTHGLAFPLSDERLPFGPARGVSNRIVASPARLDLRRGTLLAIHTPAEALR